ncbi:MAG: DNA polymerase III subunit gamma/tau [Patescibacteria group bacterium]|nr:DNA polymerase III subunit gamma/tau [Patescibacteria group bacterium]
MALTLYRKYRPQKFSEVTNQEHVKITLENQITMGQVAHAYLFAGPRGVGKTTLARILAKAVNCLERKDKESEPCNKCRSCEEIVANRAMDIVEIDAASHTGVENVRANIIENVRFSPVSLKHKVFIIDEAHMLSTSAFNALLKTLEEPPERVIFILATTEAHKIPSTIISRCQRFDFKKISVNEIAKRLEYIVAEEGIKVERPVLERIARLSEGCVRDSESLLAQILALDDKKISMEQAELVLPRTNFDQVIEFLSAVSRRDARSGVELVNRLAEDGVDMRQFSSECLEFMRNLLLAKIAGQNAELMAGWSTEIQNTINQILSAWTAADIARVIELMLVKQHDLKSASPAQLPLELFVIEAIGEEAPSFKPAEKIAAPAPEKKFREPRLPCPARPGGQARVSLDQIHEKWHDFLSGLSDANQSLNLILSVSKPTAMNGDTLEIACKYKFHCDQIMAERNRRPAEDALSALLGEKIMIQAVVQDDLPVELAEEVPAATVNSALQEFGGKVIE